MFQAQLVTSPVSLSSCEAMVTEGCVSRHPVGRLCNRLVKGIFSEETTCPTNLSPSILCNWETSVTGEHVVSTGCEAGFLPVRMGTADFSVTSNSLLPEIWGQRIPVSPATPCNL